MLKKTLITLPFLVAALAAHAQAPQPSSPAKKELVSRILKQQQGGIEGMARRLVEEPAIDLLNSAGDALPVRVAKERQEAVGKEIQADVKKYLDEAGPLVQTRAIALAPSTIGTLLEEKFTEEELRQVISIMESPIYSKYQRMGEEMQKALVEKLVVETRPTIEPKVRALEQQVARRLGVTAPAQGNGGAAPAPARPARPASR